MNQFLSVVVFLADDAPRNSGPDFGKAGPFGLLVIVLLLLGTFLLVRSMNRHLKKVPESFDPTNPEPDQAADEGAVGIDRPADYDRPADRNQTPHEPED